MDIASILGLAPPAPPAHGAWLIPHALFQDHDMWNRPNQDRTYQLLLKDPDAKRLCDAPTTEAEYLSMLTLVRDVWDNWPDANDFAKGCLRDLKCGWIFNIGDNCGEDSLWTLAVFPKET